VRSSSRGLAVAMAALALSACAARRPVPAGPSAAEAAWSPVDAVAAPTAVVTEPAGPSPPPARLVPPPDPPRAPGQRSLAGFLAAGSSRSSSAFRSVHFDLDALPTAEWKPADGASVYTVGKLGPSVFRLWVHQAAYVEVVVNDPGGAMLLSVFTGGTFGQGEPPACGPAHHGTFPTHWAGVLPKGWTDGGIDVVMGKGDFSATTCAGTARVAIAARAAAIVPGFVYGLRLEEEDYETLVVFLPRGAMVSTSGDPSDASVRASTGPFTRLSLPVDPGVGATAVLRVSPTSLAAWAHMRQTTSFMGALVDPAVIHDDLLVNVDVVSQGQAKTGEVTFAVPRGRDPGPYVQLLAAAK
jgi:hypothetical protein